MNDLKRAIYCRAFEEVCYQKITNGVVKVPTYLSAGQEFISATISNICEERKIQPAIFPQHRCHSIYLSFGGDVDWLISSLLGTTKHGSASLSDSNAKIFGHDGFIGSNAPIAVGSCYANKQPTIVFIGDAAAEEDYVLSALGWASTHFLPILFVVEDNGLSILTKTEVRRNWRIVDVANAMKLEAYDIDDDPEDIRNVSENFFKTPMLLNITTNRKYWHCGAGSDGIGIDRLEQINRCADIAQQEFIKNELINNFHLFEEKWEKAESQ